VFGLSIFRKWPQLIDGSGKVIGISSEGVDDKVDWGCWRWANRICFVIETILTQPHSRHGQASSRFSGAFTQTESCFEFEFDMSTRFTWELSRGFIHGSTFFPPRVVLPVLNLAKTPRCSYGIKGTRLSDADPPSGHPPRDAESSLTDDIYGPLTWPSPG
jgi:hypothetical protein